MKDELKITEEEVDATAYLNRMQKLIFKDKYIHKYTIAMIAKKYAIGNGVVSNILYECGQLVAKHCSDLSLIPHVVTKKYNRNPSRINKDKWWALFEEKQLVCKICGYNKSRAALDFHHRDPNTKLAEISKLMGRKYTEDKIPTFLKEVAKCDILCANCHRRVHEDLQTNSLEMETLRFEQKVEAERKQEKDNLCYDIEGITKYDVLSRR